MKKWIKGILYGNLYFGIISVSVCLLMIVLVYGVFLDNLLLMFIGGVPIVLVTLFQSMAIRDLIIYNKTYEKRL